MVFISIWLHESHGWKMSKQRHPLFLWGFVLLLVLGTETSCIPFSVQPPSCSLIQDTLLLHICSSTGFQGVQVITQGWKLLLWVNKYFLRASCHWPIPTSLIKGLGTERVYAHLSSQSKMKQTRLRGILCRTEIKSKSPRKHCSSARPRFLLLHLQPCTYFKALKKKKKRLKKCNLPELWVSPVCIIKRYDYKLTQVCRRLSDPSPSLVGWWPGIRGEREWQIFWDKLCRKQVLFQFQIE